MTKPPGIIRRGHRERLQSLSRHAEPPPTTSRSTIARHNPIRQGQGIRSTARVNVKCAYRLEIQTCKLPAISVRSVLACGIRIGRTQTVFCQPTLDTLHIAQCTYAHTIVDRHLEKHSQHNDTLDGRTTRPVDATTTRSAARTAARATCWGTSESTTTPCQAKAAKARLLRMV